QQHPDFTPAKVKWMLINSGDKLTGPKWQGRKVVNMAKAINSNAPSSTATFAPSTGLGSLDLSRGTDRVVMDGVTLTGEQDIMGKPFDSTAMASLEALGSSWSGGLWNGSSWSGSSWSGSSWSGSSWSGSSWSGS